MKRFLEQYHYTLHALAETFTTQGEAAGAYTVLELNQDAVMLEVFGKEPFKLTHPLKHPGHRWPRWAGTLRDIQEYVR